MNHGRYMTTLKFDEAELKSRRAFCELTDDDLARLKSLRPLAEQCTTEIVNAFYDLLLAHEHTRRFFPDETTIRRVKSTQSEYFLGLFEGRCDLRYVQDRLRVGAAHERIGLAPAWSLGA
jgi:rsbT co-antagonist protein RsbR